MAEYLIQDTTLIGIADAIREKTGSTEALTPADMAQAVTDLQVGGGDMNEVYKAFIESGSNKTTVDWPEGITSIGSSAFDGCTNLVLTELPAGITSIGSDAFYNCTKLALTELPAGITSIGSSAFYRCTNLVLTELPAGIMSIRRSAFDGCTNLTSLTFKGTPTGIDSTVFTNCTNLTEIKVPWAEGEVANAPWGATNATITYNYTGE